MKILFFIPAHENNKVLENCIENIQQYIVDPIIYIHANATWQDFDSNITNKYKNVFILPIRFHFVKWTSMIHIIEYAFYKSLPVEYDYFSIFHTNCLFIKTGLEEYIKDIDVTFYEFPNNASHPNAARCIQHSDLLNFIPITEVYNNLAEGNVYKKDIFLKMITFLRQKTPELMLNPNTGEECSLATTSRMFSEPNKRKAPYLFWNSTGITIEDINNNLKENNIFCLKGIPRDMDNPVRKYINDYNNFKR